jgi:hypothetical protein
MLIVNAGTPNGPEKAVQRALAPYSGVLVSGLKVLKSRGERQSESDGVLVTPTGIYVIEAKGFKRDAPRTGLLTPYQNGSWTLDGTKAQFYGDKAPDDQARNAAQQVKGHLVEKTSVRAFINGAVSIAAGNDCKMPERYVRFGDVVCAMSRDLPEALGVFKATAITPEQAWEVINSFGVSPVEMSVTLADLRAEWTKNRLLPTSSTPAAHTVTTGPTFEDMRLARQAQRAERDRNVVPLFAGAPAAPATASVVDEPEGVTTAAASSTRSTGLGCFAFLLIAAVLFTVGWHGLRWLGQDDRVEQSEEVFLQIVEDTYPNADVKADTVACREGERSALFEKTDVFCKVYGTRRGEYGVFAGAVWDTLEGGYTGFEVKD